MSRNGSLHWEIALHVALQWTFPRLYLASGNLRNGALSSSGPLARLTWLCPPDSLSATSRLVIRVSVDARRVGLLC